MTAACQPTIVNASHILELYSEAHRDLQLTKLALQGAGCMHS